MLLTWRSCDQETGGLYEAMEKAVARYEVNCVFSIACDRRLF